MLQDVKQLLIERYGERWLNGTNNQNGLADDLTISEGDVIRVNRKFGIVGRGMYLSEETEVVASYEIVRDVETLLDVDAIFYNWWGHRASENISFIQREIADDEIIYHFITGTPTHGHSGRIVIMGSRVRRITRMRLDDRFNKLQAEQQVAEDPAISADSPTSNEL